MIKWWEQVHGYQNQVYNQVFVSSIMTFKDFTFKGHYIHSQSDCFVEFIKHIRVSTIEKTVIDLINHISTYDQYEEILDIIKFIPIVNETEMLQVLAEKNKKILYNKAGLVLSKFKKQLLIKDKFSKS